MAGPLLTEYFRIWVAVGLTTLLTVALTVSSQAIRYTFMSAMPTVGVIVAAMAELLFVRGSRGGPGTGVLVKSCPVCGVAGAYSAEKSE